MGADPGGLVAVIRAAVPDLVAGLSAATINAHAVKLGAEGWTAPALGAELARQDFTDARGPGLLLSRLDVLVENGPPVVAPVVSVDEARCGDHGTRGRANCSACRSEVLTGERHPDDVGRVPELAAPNESRHEVYA
jgi:hypothetical protein